MVSMKWMLVIWVLTAEGEMSEKVGISNVASEVICDTMGEKMTRYLVDIKEYPGAMYSCKPYDPSETDDPFEDELDDDEGSRSSLSVPKEPV